MGFSVRETNIFQTAYFIFEAIFRINIGANKMRKQSILRRAYVLEKGVKTVRTRFEEKRTNTDNRYMEMLLSFSSNIQVKLAWRDD
jgi:hypothetical protein